MITEKGKCVLQTSSLQGILACKEEVLYVKDADEEVLYHEDTLMNKSSTMT